MPDLAYIAPVLRVSDLARSIAFYRDRLGFEVDFQYEDFYASVCRDTGYIHLQLQRAPAASHLDACIVVRDAASLAGRFTSAGVTFTVPLRTMPYGTEFYVRDPDGYILGFIEPASA